MITTEVFEVRLNDEIFAVTISGKKYLIQQLFHPNNDSVTLEEVGVFRYNVWSKEVNGEVFLGECGKAGVMLDALDYDPSCRNLIVREFSDGKEHSMPIIAAARMTLHSSWDDKNSRDLLIFEPYNPTLPIVDLGRLVVSDTHRKQGLAQFLNELRVHLSKLLGANTIIATASDSNARLLGLLFAHSLMRSLIHS